MAMNLTGQVRSISEVTKAVASGDLTKQVEIDVKGEMLDLKETINGMVTQLFTLASEITRVSIEVGTEGKLGGQAMVVGTTGMWKVGWLSSFSGTVLNRRFSCRLSRTTSISWPKTSRIKCDPLRRSRKLSPVAILPSKS
jgi:hypothetical protein